MNETQRFFIEETRLGIPADFTEEGLRGVAFTTATSFPAEIAMGGTWDKELVGEEGTITGDGGPGTGVHECLRSDLGRAEGSALGADRGHFW